MAEVVVGVDVGGTKVLAGVVDRAGHVVRTARRETPGRRVSTTLVEDALVAAVLDAADGRRLRAVGVSAAGFVDGPGERVMFAPHLPWQGEPVRAILSKRLAAPVYLDNDANCAAWAEYRYGAARRAHSALVITLGTGIGGALVLDGRVHRGANGMAGEFGHMQMVADGLPCECGRRGCWEQYCSGHALIRYARERIEHEPTVMAELCDGKPERLTGPMVTEAAAAGDMVAREAFADMGHWLGVGVANLVAAFDPDVVVIGGGVSDAGERLLDPARHALEQSLVGVEHRVVPRLVRAGLGPEAGLVGAASLARGAVELGLRAARRRRTGRAARVASQPRGIRSLRRTRRVGRG